jgi:hypothetical protein
MTASDGRLDYLDDLKVVLAVSVVLGVGWLFGLGLFFLMRRRSRRVGWRGTGGGRRRS